jgi:hypothetical protein
VDYQRVEPHNQEQERAAQAWDKQSGAVYEPGQQDK